MILLSNTGWSQSMRETITWMQAKIKSNVLRQEIKFDYSKNIMTIVVDNLFSNTKIIYKIPLSMITPKSIKYSCSEKISTEKKDYSMNGIQKPKMKYTSCELFLSTYNSINVIEKHELIEANKWNHVKINQMSITLSMSLELNERIERAMRHAVMLSGAKNEAF